MNLFRIVAIGCLVAPLAGLAQTATLVTTYTNPSPSACACSGYTVAVAALGSDRMLIGDDRGYGASTGVVYLFSARGGLLMTFTNPVAATSDIFGFSVSAVGSDRVLVGAPQHYTSAAAAAF